MIFARADSEMNAGSLNTSLLMDVTSWTSVKTPNTQNYYEQFEWGGVEIKIDLPKEANEMSERTTIITTLGPLETSQYKTRQRHICN